MSNNFFGQGEGNEEFRDIPDEVSGENSYVPNIQTPRPANMPQKPIIQTPLQEEIEYINEDLQEGSQEDEEDFSAALIDARLRLELGRLYEMIMQHDIFQGADADERAIKHVTRQIRTFAKEQMEIMLGMRQEVQRNTTSTIDFPFNSLEVQTLKALASAATKGATSMPEAQKTVVQPTKPKQVGLNTIGIKPQIPVINTPQPSKKTVQPTQQAKIQTKPLNKQASTPIKRDLRSDAQIERILAEEGITREEYERAFNPNYKPLNKPFHEMSEQELIDRNKQASAKRVVNPNALPMPSQEQEEMLYTQRAQAAQANPQMQSIMNLLINKKK